MTHGRAPGPELPLRRVDRDTGVDPAGRWPAGLPAVSQLLARGLDLGPVTVLVGENGAGKSTLVEGLALAFGMSSEGGSTGARHATRASESPLHRWLRLVRGAGAPRRGFFLRAETMHGFYTYLEANPNPSNRDPVFHEMSHGESFLELVVSRFVGPGLYVLDEPESALSFQGCLSLVGVLGDLVSAGGSQVVVATHSPLIAALPGARILEVGPWGLRETPWDELDLVAHWRSFLGDPRRYLRHL